MQKKNYKLAGGMFLTIQASMGILAVLTALAIKGRFHPLFFVLLRTIFSFLPMWAIAYGRDRVNPFQICFATWRWCLFLGLMGVGVSLTTYAYAIMWSSPVSTSLFAQLVPILTCAVCVIRKEESLTWQKAVGFVCSTAGVFIMILNPFGATVTLELSPLGIVALCCNVISNTSYLFILRRIFAIDKVPPLTITAMSFCGGLVSVVLFSVIAFTTFHKDVDFMSPLRDPDSVGIFALIYASLVASCGVFSLGSIGLSYSDPSYSSMFSPLQPIFTAIFSMIILGVLPTLSQLIGGCLVLCGLSLVLYARRKDFLEKQKTDAAAELQKDSVEMKNVAPTSDEALDNDQVGLLASEATFSIDDEDVPE
jgi:drug/metabolite transporter (DMT)-like permease